MSFMRYFLSAGLKGNDNLNFGILTGIMRISLDTILGGSLNNLVVCNITYTKYSDKFGFT